MTEGVGTTTDTDDQLGTERNEVTVWRTELRTMTTSPELEELVAITGETSVLDGLPLSVKRERELSHGPALDFQPYFAAP